MATIKLSDIQLVLLTTACQREDGSLLPPPASLGDQAARIRKAVTALIKQGLATEREGVDDARAWQTADDIIIGVVITDAGRAVIDPESKLAPASSSEPPAHFAEQPPMPIRAVIATTRPATKQALLLGLLKRAEGTTLAEIVSETGWLPHSSRAALTGLRKKGHVIIAAKPDGVTHYSIAVN
ncbi:MAG: DUF3489 domain-containing protein [Sphingomonadaceae bacterium]